MDYEIVLEVENDEYVVDFLTGDVIDPRSGEVVGRVVFY